MSQEEDGQRKKRVLIIGVSSFLLVGMVIAVTLGVSLNNNEHGDDQIANGSHKVSSSMKAITDICQPTDYKKECIQSLNSTVGNSTTDPIELIKATFQITMKHIGEAAKNSTTLHELEKEPRARQALDQCKELMNHAIDEIKRSFDKLGNFENSKTDELLADLKIWLSSAISYQETCLDGFQNTTSTAEEKMRKALKLSMRLSSNGLAIVNEVSAFIQQYNIDGVSRRLLQADHELPVLAHNDFPSWFNPGARRLLRGQMRQTPNIVVAQDGSGKYRTINEALEEVPKYGNRTFAIYIKEGIYNEYVQINKTMTNLLMIGDGASKTRITGNKNFIDGITTFRTASVAVIGDRFMAKNIGFENSAGAAKHQAVALRVQSDMSVFYNCSMDGYQDTLYVHVNRQFYRDCTISGTIDFVFGDAASVFQNCTFLVRRPLPNQQNIVTAQGRKEWRQPSAIVLQNCTITAAPELYPVRMEVKSYLGRPWKEFSRTIIMESYIDDLIQPDGWMPWLGDFGLKTCFYTEFNNWGPGSSKAKRVRWRGIKTITADQATRFTPRWFIWGDRWIRRTRVPYTSGMISTNTTNSTTPGLIPTNTTSNSTTPGLIPTNTTNSTRPGLIPANATTSSTMPGLIPTNTTNSTMPGLISTNTTNPTTVGFTDTGNLTMPGLTYTTNSTIFGFTDKTNSTTLGLTSTNTTNSTTVGITNTTNSTVSGLTSTNTTKSSTVGF